MNKMVESRPPQPASSRFQMVARIAMLLMILCLAVVVLFLLIMLVDGLRGHPGQTMEIIGAWVGQVLIVLLPVIVLAAILAGAALIYKVNWAHTDRVRADEMKQEKVVFVRETRQLVTTATTRGFNAEVVLGDDMTPTAVKVINPISLRPASKETNNYYGIQQEQEQIVPPAPTPQLAAPETTVHLSDEYRVPANDVLSGRKLIVGISGSGKSNTVGVYSEELGALKVPMILADTEDEYRPLCIPKFLPNGMLAGASIVTPENAYQFGQYVLQEMRQVILNLQSYEEMEQAALVMIGIIHGMRDWEEERDYRIPSEFILEEAVTWLPQNIKESPLYGTDTLNTLQGTFFNDMVRKGRKRGLGLTVVCQKIAEVDKRTLQADAKILHYQNEGPDLKRYEEMGIKTDETLTLQKGDAFLFTSRVSKRRVHVRRRYSEHGANTPGLENLQRYQQTRTLSELDSEPWRTSEPSNLVRPQFGAHVEPVREVLGDMPVGAKSSQRDIPPELRTEIVRRYRNGEGRKKIQTELRIAGDQFWQLRDICNEVDHERNAERA